MKRARSQIEKQEREKAILEGAWKLLQRKTCESLTMDEVASAAGLAKGTLYLYFGSKEALFLSLIESQLSPLVADINRWLNEQAGDATPESAAAYIARSFNRKRSLARMILLIFPVLEDTLDIELSCRFKETVGSYSEEMGRALESAITGMPHGSGSKLSILALGLGAVLYHTSHTSSAFRRIMESPAQGGPYLNSDNTFEQILSTAMRLAVGCGDSSVRSPR